MTEDDLIFKLSEILALYESNGGIIGVHVNLDNGSDGFDLQWDGETFIPLSETLWEN